MIIEKYTKHWSIVSNDYQKQFGEWNSLLNELIVLAEEGAKQIAGAKSTLENATYLLLAKSFNHVLSMQVLLERGLLIDAALSARNALETLLLTQAILLDPTEKYAAEWLKGKQFSPSWAKNRLENVANVKVREVIVSSNDDVSKMAYSWLSDITHANKSSFGYVTTELGDNSYEVNIGGSIKGQQDFIKAVLAVISKTLYEASVLAACILCLPWFENKSANYKELQTKINEKMRRNKSV